MVLCKWFFKIILTSLCLVEGLVWWDWPFIWWTDQLLSFSAWHCWLGHLTRKNCLQYDLWCVWWDVKPYSILLLCVSVCLSVCVYVCMYVCLWQNGISPLHVSSKWGRTNVVSLLLDSNANIDCRTRVCISVISLCSWLLPYAGYVAVIVWLAWHIVSVSNRSESSYLLQHRCNIKFVNIKIAQEV